MNSLEVRLKTSIKNIKRQKRKAKTALRHGIKSGVEKIARTKFKSKIQKLDAQTARTRIIKEILRKKSVKFKL